MEKIENMIDLNSKKIESIFDEIEKLIELDKRPDLDTAQRSKVIQDLKVLMKTLRELEIITKKDLHELGEDAQDLIQEFRYSSHDEEREEQVLNDFRTTLKEIIDADKVGRIDENRKRQFERMIMRLIREESSERRREDHEH